MNCFSCVNDDDGDIIRRVHYPEDHIEVQEGPNRRARSIMVNMDNHLNHPDDDAVRVWERNRNLKNPKATKENINEILRAIAFNKALSLKRSVHKSP